MKNKTILILGSDGQLGTEVTNIYSKTKNTILTPNIKELDITDKLKLESFFDNNNIDIVLNCAAYTAVDTAETEQNLANLLNANAPSEIAKITSEKDIKFIHVSTDYVFNGENFTPYKETDTTKPLGIYGESKLQGENLIQKFNKNAIIIRTSWLYSVTGNNFVKTMIRLGTKLDSLGVIYDQVGTPTYAVDLANAIYNIAKRILNSDKNNSGIYHFSNEGVCSWYDFAKEIMTLAKVDCEVKPIETKDFPTPTKRPAYSVLNKAKIKETFNIEIPYWHDSLIDCIKELYRIT